MLLNLVPYKDIHFSVIADFFGVLVAFIQLQFAVARILLLLLPPFETKNKMICTIPTLYWHIQTATVHDADKSISTMDRLQIRQTVNQTNRSEWRGAKDDDDAPNHI